MTRASDVAFSFSGSNVLVTGATSGIGRATAVAFGGAGAHVLVSGRDRTRGEESCEAVRSAGGRATLLLADLTRHEAVLELARSALEGAGGPIDVLVNCAGGGGFMASEAATREDYDAAFDLLVRAPFFLTAAIAPKMAEQGRGAVINIASAGTVRGIAGLCLFSSAKAALNAMTRNWAAEFGPRGVAVNAIDVGAIETPVNAGHRDLVAELMARIPARRMGQPAEVASVVLFLASSGASYIQGATLPVDGGFEIS